MRNCFRGGDSLGEYCWSVGYGLFLGCELGVGVGVGKDLFWWMGFGVGYRLWINVILWGGGGVMLGE